MTNSTLRLSLDNGVFSITLSRPRQYNTITAELRDALNQALDQAQSEPEARVVLLRAEGPAFCAGYDLQMATDNQANEAAQRSWDSVSDYHVVSSYVRVFQKLWYLSKPTIASVQGWCLAGGCDLALWADVIVAGRSASFGYPPARVWGIPTNPMWLDRLGHQAAKRYLLTGDEILAPRALELGLVQEVFADAELEGASLALARRMARLPLNQLEMLKIFCNHQAEQTGLQTTKLLGTLFDGIARHTQEGQDFVARAASVGFRQAVRERDAPFGDYGTRKCEAFGDATTEMSDLN
jgi:enoyl-CoA hydratase